jgi:hypothetical protein
VLAALRDQGRRALLLAQRIHRVDKHDPVLGEAGRGRGVSVPRQ